MQIKVDLDARDFQTYLKSIKNKKRIEKIIQKSLAKVGIFTRRSVIPKTPRDSGDLLNSWKVKSKYLSIEVGFDIVYALYQHQGMREKGTHIIINRPAGGETYFLKNAINENINKITAMFEQALFDEILTA